MSENTNPIEDAHEMKQSSAPVEKKDVSEPRATPDVEPRTFGPGLVQNEEPSAKTKRLRKEFRTGFNMSLILNGVAMCFYLFFIGIENIERSTWNWQPVWQLGSIWLVVNIIILVLLAIQRRKIFEGLVAGLAIAFLIMFVLGVVMTGVCYGSV